MKFLIIATNAGVVAVQINHIRKILPSGDASRVIFGPPGEPPESLLIQESFAKLVLRLNSD
jgi:hypothetical protein